MCKKCDDTGFIKFGTGPMTRYEKCRCQNEKGNKILEKFHSEKVSEAQKLSEKFLKEYKQDIDWSYLQTSN